MHISRLGNLTQSYFACTCKCFQRIHYTRRHGWCGVVLFGQCLHKYFIFSLFTAFLTFTLSADVTYMQTCLLSLCNFKVGTFVPKSLHDSQMHDGVLESYSWANSVFMLCVSLQRPSSGTSALPTASCRDTWLERRTGRELKRRRRVQTNTRSHLHASSSQSWPLPPSCPPSWTFKRWLSILQHPQQIKAVCENLNFF